MNNGTPKPTTVLCVDDNPLVADALRVLLTRAGYAWQGSFPNADGLVEHVRTQTPHLIIFDLDMPGVDPIDTLAQLAGVCPDCRAVVFSGHVRADLIDRAVDAGAWGYISKNDGEVELLAALKAVAAGEFALSPEVRRIHSTRA